MSFTTNRSPEKRTTAGRRRSSSTKSVLARLPTNKRGRSGGESATTILVTNSRSSRQPSVGLDTANGSRLPDGPLEYSPVPPASPPLVQVVADTEAAPFVAETPLGAESEISVFESAGDRTAASSLSAQPTLRATKPPEAPAKLVAGSHSRALFATLRIFASALHSRNTRRDGDEAVVVPASAVLTLWQRLGIPPRVAKETLCMWAVDGWMRIGGSHDTFNSWNGAALAATNTALVRVSSDNAAKSATVGMTATALLEANRQKLDLLETNGSWRAAGVMTDESPAATKPTDTDAHKQAEAVALWSMSEIEAFTGNTLVFMTAQQLDRADGYSSGPGGDALAATVEVQMVASIQPPPEQTASRDQASSVDKFAAAVRAVRVPTPPPATAMQRLPAVLRSRGMEAIRAVSCTVLEQRISYHNKLSLPFLHLCLVESYRGVCMQDEVTRCGSTEMERSGVPPACSVVWGPRDGYFHANFGRHVVEAYAMEAAAASQVPKYNENATLDFVAALREEVESWQWRFACTLEQEEQLWPDIAAPMERRWKFIWEGSECEEEKAAGDSSSQPSPASPTQHPEENVAALPSSGTTSTSSVVTEQRWTARLDELKKACLHFASKSRRVDAVWRSAPLKGTEVNEAENAGDQISDSAAGAMPAVSSGAASVGASSEEAKKLTSSNTAPQAAPPHPESQAPTQPVHTENTKRFHLALFMAFSQLPSFHCVLETAAYEGRLLHKFADLVVQSCLDLPQCHQALLTMLDSQWSRIVSLYSPSLMPQRSCTLNDHEVLDAMVSYAAECDPCCTPFDVLSVDHCAMLRVLHYMEASTACSRSPAMEEAQAAALLSIISWEPWASRAATAALTSETGGRPLSLVRVIQRRCAGLIMQRSAASLMTIWEHLLLRCESLLNTTMGADHVTVPELLACLDSVSQVASVLRWARLPISSEMQCKAQSWATAPSTKCEALRYVGIALCEQDATPDAKPQRLEESGSYLILGILQLVDGKTLESGEAECAARFLSHLLMSVQGEPGVLLLQACSLVTLLYPTLSLETFPQIGAVCTATCRFNATHICVSIANSRIRAALHAGAAFALCKISAYQERVLDPQSQSLWAHLCSAVFSDRDVHVDPPHAWLAESPSGLPSWLSCVGVARRWNREVHTPMLLEEVQARLCNRWIALNSILIKAADGLAAASLPDVVGEDGLWKEQDCGREKLLMSDVVLHAALQWVALWILAPSAEALPLTYGWRIVIGAMRESRCVKNGGRATSLPLIRALEQDALWRALAIRLADFASNEKIESAKRAALILAALFQAAFAVSHNDAAVVRRWLWDPLSLRCRDALCRAWLEANRTSLLRLVAGTVCTGPFGDSLLVALSTSTQKVYGPPTPCATCDLILLLRQWIDEDVIVVSFLDSLDPHASDGGSEFRMQRLSSWIASDANRICVVLRVLSGSVPRALDGCSLYASLIASSVQSGMLDEHSPEVKLAAHIIRSKGVERHLCRRDVPFMKKVVAPLLLALSSNVHCVLNEILCMAAPSQQNVPTTNRPWVVVARVLECLPHHECIFSEMEEHESLVPEMFFLALLLLLQCDEGCPVATASDRQNLQRLLCAWCRALEPSSRAVSLRYVGAWLRIMVCMCRNPPKAPSAASLHDALRSLHTCATSFACSLRNIDSVCPPKSIAVKAECRMAIPGCLMQLVEWGSWTAHRQQPIVCECYAAAEELGVPISTTAT